MRYKRIRLETENRVARLTLSGRPLNTTEAREIDEAVKEISVTSDVRVLLLTSAGPDFAPGADVDLKPTVLEVDPAAAIAAYELPVVAALKGSTTSVGLEIALAADIRIADNSLVASIPNISQGVIPCWGGTQRLARQIGVQNALWLLLMGTSMNAEESLKVGLIQETTHPDDLGVRVEELIQHLSSKSPLALRYLKEAVHHGADLSLREGMRLEGDLNTLLISSHDRDEGIQAFFEKRPPQFEGR